MARHRTAGLEKAHGQILAAHLVGLMLMSAGLIGVLVADIRSGQVRDVPLFAQAINFIAVFYDGLVVPGALLLLASGTWLIVEYYGGWSWTFLGTPGLPAWFLLFAFEFIEGNTTATAAQQDWGANN